MHATSMNKPIYTATLENALKINPALVNELGLGPKDQDALLRLANYRQTLLHKSMVIAGEAAALKRRENLRVTTVKGCGGKNLFAYIDAPDAIYALLETPLTCLVPKDRQRIEQHPDYQLIRDFDDYRVRITDADNAMSSTAVKDELTSVERSDDQSYVDVPVLKDPYTPTNPVERFLRWLGKKLNG